MMEGQYLYLLVLLASASGTSLDIHLRCPMAKPVDYRSCTGPGTGSHLESPSVGDSNIIIQTSITCKECTLEFEMTEGNGIHLELTGFGRWSAMNYFYLETSTQNAVAAFTRAPQSCLIFISSTDITINFRMTATLNIQQYLSPRQITSPCNITDLRLESSRGNPQQDSIKHCCNSLEYFDKVFQVKYKIVRTNLDSRHIPNKVFTKFYGDSEKRGHLPTCPDNCQCHLLFHQFYIQCSNDTSNLLITHEDVFDNLQQISLDASDSRLVSVAAMALKGLSQVNRLCLNGNELSQIDAATFEGTNLFVLELAKNSISWMSPNSLHSMPFLRYLDLSFNKLRELPRNLFQNQHTLRVIDFSNNQLVSFSSEVICHPEALFYLFLSGNNLTTLQGNIFTKTTYLQWLYLDNNQIKSATSMFLNQTSLRKLTRLHLSGNMISSLETGIFSSLEELTELTLTKNKLNNIKPYLFQDLTRLLLLKLEENVINDVYLDTFGGLDKLLVLKLSGNSIKHVQILYSRSKNNFDESVPVDPVEKIDPFLPNLRLLDMRNNDIEFIEFGVFEHLPSLELVELHNNPLTQIVTQSFVGMNIKSMVFVDKPATCCFLDNVQNCKPLNTKAPYLTCARLLPHITIRTFMWIFGVLALTGNLTVLMWRCVNHNRENIVQVILIQNLALSDFLMGIYMIIIAAADVYYQEYFPTEAENWRTGAVCKLAGIISILSSEASVFFIMLISIDRFFAIRHHGGKRHLTQKLITIITLLCWSLALLLSIIPPTAWNNKLEFYDESEVCIGLPFVRSVVYYNQTAMVDFSDFPQITSDRIGMYGGEYLVSKSGSAPGMLFSIVIFLVINLICFLIVAASYIYIFIIYKKSVSRFTMLHKNNREMTLALRMALLVITDFLCWMPIIVIGILVQAAVIDISPIVYVYIVVFVLPINSAVNPFLYTVGIVLSNRRRTEYVDKCELVRYKKKSNSIEQTNTYI